jgi:hypothetical protein
MGARLRSNVGFSYQEGSHRTMCGDRRQHLTITRPKEDSTITYQLFSLPIALPSPTPTVYMT